MRILSLDLGRRLGWADGADKPTYGACVLREVGADNGLALGRLARWLEARFSLEGKPDLIVCEHWLPPFGQKSMAAVEDALRMNGVVHAIAGLNGIAVTEPYPATIRAEVCGRPHMVGDGRIGGVGRKMANTKIMVIEAMIRLGYLPADCTDDNIADAVCAWVWGQANFAATPINFQLSPA